MLEIKDFSFTGDFHLINWPATIKYNFARYGLSWVILSVLILIFYRGSDALALALVLPISLPLAAAVLNAVSILGRVGGLFALVGLYFSVCYRVIRLAALVPGDLVLSAAFAFRRELFLQIFRVIPPLFTTGLVVCLVNTSEASGVHTYR